MEVPQNFFCFLFIFFFFIVVRYRFSFQCVCLRFCRILLAYIMNSGAPGGAAQRDLLTSLAPCDSGTCPPLRSGSGSRFQVWQKWRNVIGASLQLCCDSCWRSCSSIFLPSARCSRLLSLTFLRSCMFHWVFFYPLQKLLPGLIHSYSTRKMFLALVRFEK